MKRSLLTATLSVLLLLPTSSTFGDMGKDGMMGMPMMQEHMSRMQEHLHKLKAAKSDQERMSLMQEHMQLMHDHMKMMMDRMGGGCMMMGGDKGAEKSSAISKAPPGPAGVSEEEHRKHHGDP